MKPVSDPKTEQILVRISEALLDYIEKEHEKKNISRAEVVRTALEAQKKKGEKIK